MSTTDETLGLRTQAVHAGDAPDPVTGASAPNLVMSTTFLADPDAGFSASALGDEPAFVYTRWGNPTVAQLEKKLAALEKAQACIALASGMAAVTTLLIKELKSGDHMVVSDVAYAGTAELTAEIIPSLGIKVTKVDTSDLDAVCAALTHDTKLVFIETPNNPLLRLTDINAVASIAHSSGAKLVVDSTFATPCATQPIELGADYVIHSLTKYLCGHGDAIGGAILAKANDVAELRQVAIRSGGVLSPFNAWLIHRGIATLPLRMKAHSETAQQVAEFLEEHPKVAQVIYPGLSSHPQSTLAREQMRLFSGMITFQLKDGADAARRLAERLRIIHYAVSLGHHRSLVFYLSTADMLESSFHLNPEQEASYRRFAGDGIFRLSVGIEDAADLCRDLNSALS